MSRRAATRSISAGVFALIMALQIGGTQAAVDNLRSALLPSAAVPAAFVHPHIKLYTHFVSKMQVMTSIGTIKSPSACILPAALARDGWTQGLIEAFDRAKVTSSLQLCASLFKTSHGAHLAYKKLVSAGVTPQLKQNVATPLSISGVGDEAAGIQRNGIRCACGTGEADLTYEIVFRHDNALIDLTYSGPDSYTTGQFERLVTRTNQQLH